MQIGAWMVDAPYFGRRRSLAFSTFATAVGCAVFAGARTPILVRTSSMFIALASTTMYAVLYVRCHSVVLMVWPDWLPELDARDLSDRDSRYGMWYRIR
jgi:hypothetical protein